MAKVAVLGGGISGLAAAHYLQSVGPTRVVVVEASHRLGGWVHSSTHHDGLVFEHGPRTLRVAGNAAANTLALAETLGLADEVHYVTYNQPSAKNRMILVDGKLHKLPNSLKMALTKTPPFSRPLALSALSDLRANKVHNNDESLYSFVTRRFGPDVAAYAIDPLSRGVFAGNAKNLSVKSLAKRLHEVEQQYGSVLLGLIKGRKSAEKPDASLANFELVKKARKEKWSVWSVKGGLENLVKSLENNVLKDGVEIWRNTPVKGIVKSGKNLVIQTDNQETEVEKVVSCLPANCLSPLVRPLSEDLSNLLGAIPYVTVGLVNLAFPGHLIQDPAFGYLVPSSQPNKVLGVIYDTCVFPQGDRTVLTVMMGGYWFRQLFGSNPSADTLLEVALNELQQTLNITVQPECYDVKLLRDCIPQYVVGHSETVHNVRKLIRDLKLPLTLGGMSYDGVGVNDSIYSAKKAVLS